MTHKGSMKAGSGKHSMGKTAGSKKTTGFAKLGGAMAKKNTMDSPASCK